MERFLKNKISLHCGDCLAIMRELPENHFHSCVTDPPYHLTSIVKRFSNMGPNDKKLTMGRVNQFQRTAVGFMQKKWDGGDIAFRPETWAAVFRALRPGAHLLAFSGTRTYHRMACAIEDAGFEIRDQIQWLYGSGFPKSHNQENGWGTALKPACEPIVLARKPLSEKTIAENIARWKTGGINIDACRIESEDDRKPVPYSKGNEVYGDLSYLAGEMWNPREDGRWPANVIHDGSKEVIAAFPDLHGAGSAQGKQEKWADQPESDLGWGKIGSGPNGARYGDEGNAARFFYSAKADSDDRLGSKHPTVKPLDLIQYLVRLVTSKGGMVLDPFAGTGTTGEAAWREGFSAELIEREEEYQADIRRRMALCLSGPDERAREAIKAKMKDKPQDAGPLFGGEM